MDHDHDQNPLAGEESSAVEGDGDAGRYSLMVRCASQSSLDECSQRAEPGAGARAAHAARLLDALARLRGDAALTDVTLKACPEVAVPGAAPEGVVPVGAAEEGEGEGVRAHRAVLAASSPYFRAMFTQFDERTMPVITIQNVEPAALRAIVDYIYNPYSLVVTEDNVQALLAGASLLQVCGARAAGCGFLARALAPDNALGIRAFAELHACADLAAAATRFLHRHFLQVLDGEEFLALPADALAALIGSDAITVPNEEVILDAVIRWMQHDPEERRAQLGALLQHVRLPLLPRDALVARAAAEPLASAPVQVLAASHVYIQERRAQLGALLQHVRLPLLPRDALVARAAAEPLASAPVQVKDLVIEALSFHLMRPERRRAAAAGCARARPRRPAPAPRALLVAGGQAPKAVRDVELLAPEAARWRAAAPLPARRCRAGLAALPGRVLAVGGFNGTLRVRSVDVYDVAADAWAPGPPLAARRSTLGVAVIDDVVYAVGGFDGTAGLSSAEALAPGAAAWRAVAPMSTRRSSVGVAALGGRLYAVGGYDGQARQCLQSVERYDPATDSWERVADMAARRSGAGVGALGGALYAVGGHDGPAVRRSAERWRPGPGGAAPGAWAPVAPMAHARRNAGVVAHDGRLYVVGGDDGAANLASVEVYDPATDTWALLAAPMALGRSYAGVCAVELA